MVPPLSLRLVEATLTRLRCVLFPSQYEVARGGDGIREHEEMERRIQREMERRAEFRDITRHGVPLEQVALWPNCDS